MVKSASLIALGISIGVIATHIVRQTPSPQSESNSQASASSSSIVDSISVRDASDASDDGGLLDIIAELEDVVTDLNARLQNSRRLVTYYESRDLREQEAARGPSPDQIAEKLVDAGLTQDRAEWIIERHDELYRESMAANFSVAGYADSWEGLLRQELGDADFEAYLRARGGVPAVQVGAVGETSAAGLAGLRYGDQIRSYDGHRVFDIRELIPLTLQHEADETVVIDILRDGQPLQLIVPGGILDAELSSGGMFTARSFDPKDLYSQ